MKVERIPLDPHKGNKGMFLAAPCRVRLQEETRGKTVFFRAVGCQTRSPPVSQCQKMCLNALPKNLRELRSLAVIFNLSRPLSAPSRSAVGPRQTERRRRRRRKFWGFVYPRSLILSLVSPSSGGWGGADVLRSSNGFSNKVRLWALRRCNHASNGGSSENRNSSG